MWAFKERRKKEKVYKENGIVLNNQRDKSNNIITKDIDSYFDSKPQKENDELELQRLAQTDNSYYDIDQALDRELEKAPKLTDIPMEKKTNDIYEFIVWLGRSKNFLKFAML